jgi:hypothetical protein
MKTNRLCIEALEPRIAPASTTVSYVDIDGDLVRIKASNTSGEAPPLDAADLTFVGGGSTGQLALLNLVDPGFSGSSITFTVVKKIGGNGLADVGRIDATGVLLGSVVVKGDLGVIDAGAGSDGGVVSLKVRSMGVQGLATQGGTGDLHSNIVGSLGALLVQKDLKDAIVRVSGGTFATIGRVFIGGSLIGGAGAESGSIECAGDIGPVVIRGDMLGGSGEQAGGIDVGGEIASLTVRGSIIGATGSFFSTLGGTSFHEGQVIATGAIGPVKVGRNVIGGDGFASGEIRSGTFIASITIGGSLIGGLGVAGGHLCSDGAMGPVKIGRDIIGGRSIFTGWIEGFQTIGDISIGGSLIGGPSSASGFITALESLGRIKIGGDLIGGSISGTAPGIDSSGTIQSYGGRIASVTLRGSIIAGVDASTSGGLSNSGTIGAGDDIGSLTVKGNLIGNITANGISRVTITARGQETPGASSDLAIGKISIGGRVEHTQILAGHTGFAAVNGNAQIGLVTVGGDWRASSLVAGIQDVEADGFGDADDVVISTPPADAIVSRIASVTIKGFVFGTGATGDHFGFTAQQIGSFKAGGIKLSLTEATDAPFQLALITDDVRLREV